ncbi:protein-lysine N-methyltransferase EEF2KMT [Pyxicephalus adspersus]|uniref:protein-lysine N-methyltransferase EEF2KMT n=1 Tax=Pyxicephalus adspersus TaxID=30357 RepID=UPI003B5B9C4A
MRRGSSHEPPGMRETVNHPLCRRYPPSLQYRRLFLLELIKKHENTKAEPQDELYDALAEVLNAGETTKCYKSYLLPSGSYVTLWENPAIISEGTTGLVTWEAALFLAEWAIENVDIFRNRDCHQKVLSKLRENIDLNGFVLADGDEYMNNRGGVKESDDVQLSVLELDWESITGQQLSHIDVDLIVAAAQVLSDRGIV